MQKSPGQGLNLCHSSDRNHSSDKKKNQTKRKSQTNTKKKKKKKNQKPIHAGEKPVLKIQPSTYFCFSHNHKVYYHGFTLFFSRNVNYYFNWEKSLTLFCLELYQDLKKKKTVPQQYWSWHLSHQHSHTGVSVCRWNYPLHGDSTNRCKHLTASLCFLF